MDDLDKKAQQGLDAFNKNNNGAGLKTSLDSLVDDLVGNEEDPSSMKGRGNKYTWIYGTLVILLLSIIGYLGFKSSDVEPQKVSSEVLFAQNFKVMADAIGGNERGFEGESMMTSSSDLGMQLYNAGNYEKAAEVLSSENNAGYLLYCGVSYMKIENFKMANVVFGLAAKTANYADYKDAIKWYSALNFLRLNDTKMAKSYFLEMAESEHFNKEAAKNILSHLD